VARGVASLGLGLAVGALLGRMLPAMLLAAFASVLLFSAVSFGMDRWLEADAVVTPGMNGGIGSDTDGALLLGSRIELLNGKVVAWDYGLLGYNQVIDADGAVYTAFDEDTGMPDPSSLVGWERQLVIAGREYPGIVARESGAVAGIGILFGVTAAFIVRRRRPA